MEPKFHVKLFLKFQLKFCEIYSKISWNFTWNFRGVLAVLKFLSEMVKNGVQIENFRSFCEILWNFNLKFHEISMKFIAFSEIVKFRIHMLNSVYYIVIIIHFSAIAESVINFIEILWKFKLKFHKISQSFTKTSEIFDLNTIFEHFAKKFQNS